MDLKCLYCFTRSFLGSNSPVASTSTAFAPETTKETQERQDALLILESLIEHVHNGLEIAQRILMLYRISVNIEIEYHEIAVAKNLMEIMKESLKHDCKHKLEVVHDFIFLYKWDKEKVCLNYPLNLY